MNFFKGGYFGVDIFFVISGFVITNFIYSQYCRSIFSIKDFYIRRVKRLIPNLLCCITFTLCLGYFFLLPENYLNLSKQSIFSSLSLANFYFYFSGVEYNAENPKLLPLLHTWSLSVEEQFYLLFPLFFIFFFKKKIFVQVSAICILISVLSGLYLSRIDNDLSFYVLLTRIFELLSGSLTFLISKQIRLNKISKNVPTICFVCICLLVASTTDEMLTPSFQLILIIILSSTLIGTINNKDLLCYFLRMRLIVFFGVISYSIYLYHFPIISFARHLQIIPLQDHTTDFIFTKLILIVLILLISILFYYLIEKNFRYKKSDSTKIIRFLLYYLICLLLFCIYVITEKGSINKNFPIHFQLMQNDHEDFFIDGKECRNRKNNFCNTNINLDKSVILIGDSHMGVLSSTLANKINKDDFNYIDLTTGGMILIPDYVKYRNKDKKLIHDKHMNNKRANLIFKKPESLVILGGRLPKYTKNIDMFGNYEKTSMVKNTVKLEDLNKEKNSNNIFEDLENFIIELKKKHKLLIVYPFPELQFDINQMLISDYYGINEIELEKNFDLFKNWSRETYDFYDKITAKYNIPKVVPESIICPGEECLYIKNKKILYSDRHHMSKYGADIITEVIINKVKTNFENYKDLN